MNSFVSHTPPQPLEALSVFERVQNAYPAQTLALAGSLRSRLGLPITVQMIVDLNFVFLTGLRDDGLNTLQIASLINDAGFADINGRDLNVKTLASAIERTRRKTSFQPSNRQQLNIPADTGSALPVSAGPTVKNSTVDQSNQTSNVKHHRKGAALLAQFGDLK